MTFTLTLNHNGVDVSGYTEAQVSLTNGRRTTSEQFRGRGMNVSLVWDSFIGALDPLDFQVNDTLVLTVTTTGVGGAGYAYDLVISDVRIDRNRVNLTAVSRQYAWLGRSQLDLPAYTDQLTGYVIRDVLDRALAAGIVTAAAVADVSATNGTVTVSTDAGTYNLLQFLQTVAASEPLGMLMERRQGTSWLSYNDFRNTASNFSTLYDFSAKDIWAYPWELTRTAADYANTAVVNWRGGSVSFTDPVSVAAVGKYETSVSTYIANQTDAEYLARRIVTFGTDPGLRINELKINTADPSLTAGNRNQIANAMFRPGRRIKTPTIVTGGPTEWVVHGRRDDFVYGGGAAQWKTTFYVIDRTYWDVAQRWQDVISGVTWATVNPAYTWQQLERFDI